MDDAFKRLKQIASEKGIKTNTDIGKELGVAPQVITNWKKRGIPASKILDIANKFGVSAEWLRSGKGPKEASSTQIAPLGKGELDTIDLNNASPIATMPKVPLISFVQAGDWQEIILNPPDDIEYIPCPVPCGPNTFSVNVEGESMLPRFQPGELIFIDPDKGYRSGDFVIAQIDHENKATFKQYLETEDGPMLKALNPEWPKRYMPLPEGSRIIGRVIAKMEMLN